MKAWTLPCKQWKLAQKLSPKQLPRSFHEIFHGNYHGSFHGSIHGSFRVRTKSFHGQFCERKLLSRKLP